jgi:putative RNA 2'-phosphotransferase
MDTNRLTRISRFLSLVLRHEPQNIGITLDTAGWVDVRTLLDAMATHGNPIGEAELREVVHTNDKKRFAFSEDGQRIRASQGHSVPVDLGYSPATPPAVLYHGTVDQFLVSIRQTGLKPGQRHHVHLSPDEPTAIKVGQRRGKPVILRIDAARMHADGHSFLQSANGVWLTDHVPPAYITFPC